MKLRMAARAASMIVLVAALTASTSALAGDDPAGECGAAWFDARSPARDLTTRCVYRWGAASYGSFDHGPVPDDFDPCAQGDTLDPSPDEPIALAYTVEQLQRGVAHAESACSPNSALTIAGRTAEGLTNMVSARFALIEHIDTRSIDAPLWTILQGKPLVRAELWLTTPDDAWPVPSAALWKLRGAVFARHGKTFEHPDLNRFFYGDQAPLAAAELRHPEYGAAFFGPLPLEQRLELASRLESLKPDPTWAADRLTAIDRANLALVDAAATGRLEPWPARDRWEALWQYGCAVGDIDHPSLARGVRNVPFAVGGHTFKSPELDAFFRADGGWYTPTGASVQLDPTAAECVARLKLHEKELRAASPVAKDLEVRLLTQHDALVTVSSAVTESVEVLALVDAIGALVAKHDWKAVLAHCDPSHYKVQVDQMGMGEPQYVAEALGLHAVGNSIAGESGIAWDDINRISKIEVASFTGSADWLEAHGSVTLSDGSTLKLTFVLVRAGERWFISGAVG